VTAHKHGGWHKAGPVPRETPGFEVPTVVTRRTWNPPKDSWWTKARSREEFDQLAEQRSRDAGWVGKPREDPR
jgi:hypothetical protein